MKLINMNNYILMSCTREWSPKEVTTAGWFITF